MAKEGSVAPKERVNITYKPATGDAQEQVELPLKMLMLGDFTFRPDSTPLEERRPISIDKDNFGEVMAKQDLQVSVSVADKLSGAEGSEMAVKLKFQSMRDFEPEGIVRQVPELRQLLELRAALSALRGPLGNIPAVRKKIEALLGDQGSREKLMAELGLGDKAGG